jgi:hypothetical protein
MVDEPTKRATIAKCEERHSFGHGSMICAVFVAIMVFYWFIRRLSGTWDADEGRGAPVVLGIIAFFIGHVLAITSLFSKKSVTWWWGRTALVTMWITIVILILADVLFSEL